MFFFLVLLGNKLTLERRDIHRDLEDECQRRAVKRLEKFLKIKIGKNKLVIIMTIIAERRKAKKRK